MNRTILISALAVLAGASLSAQQPVKKGTTAAAFDRTISPPAGATPTLQVPAWTTSRLSNGAKLIVSQRRNLPLVSFTIEFIGGASQYEPADKSGLAGLTSAMLSEGTTSRSGDELSNALQLLGSGIGAGIASENGFVSFKSTTDKFQGVLAILADMLENPSLPSEALERLRAQRLVALKQSRDRTASIASRVFANVLYTDAHPYGRVMTEQSVSAITRDDVVAFHRAYFTPGHAIISVVGDVDPAAVRATIERVLNGWTAVGPAPSFAYPTTPAPKATTIYLVDKPGAAQSSFLIGLPGPSRSTPDYFSIAVMNNLLGQLFQSRLNANIREQKGYSYGVGSGFRFGKGPGSFAAGGDIVTAKSDSALIEFMKELRGIGGTRPVTDEELKASEDNLVQGLPQRFTTIDQLNGQIAGIYAEGLPEDYFQHYTANVRAVTKEDVERVARRYIDMDHLAIVVVGDRKTIEQPLRQTGIAPIVLLDLDGKPIPTVP